VLYSWHVGGRTVWGHGGGDQGVTTEMWFDPATDIGVVALTNGEAYFDNIVDALFDYAEQHDPWADLGDALAGTHGDPVLAGSGPLERGTPIGLSLSNALESTGAYLVVGFSRIDLPFYGGTLVPGFEPPQGLFIPLATNGSGEIAINDSWPAGVPAGFTTYFQYWIVDGGGPFGMAASNAISGTTLP
jgi:hypothetical protein